MKKSAHEARLRECGKRPNIQRLDFSFVEDMGEIMPKMEISNYWKEQQTATNFYKYLKHEKLNECYDHKDVASDFTLSMQRFDEHRPFMSLL